MMSLRTMVTLALGAWLAAHGLALAADRCLVGASAAQDRLDIEVVRAAIGSGCPCNVGSHATYTECARGLVKSAVGAGALRKACRSTVVGIERHSTCGTSGRVACLIDRGGGRHPLGCKITTVAQCTDRGTIHRRACPAATHCLDAGDSNGDGVIAPPDDLRCVTRTTVDIPSAGVPAHTPGSPGVVVTNPKLLAQFGGGSFSLNNARYTRFRSHRPGVAPDAVLILVPGFEGGRPTSRSSPRT